MDYTDTNVANFTLKYRIQTTDVASNIMMKFATKATIERIFSHMNERKSARDSFKKRGFVIIFFNIGSS